jgi:uncharacterized membrane protein YhhN
MKLKHALLLIVLGLCAYVVGALFKIEHWTGDDALLIGAAALIVSGLLLATIKLLRHTRTRRLLNY